MESINVLNSLNALNAANEITFQSVQTRPKLNKPEETSKTAFEGFFDAATKLLEDTSRLQLEDEQLQIDYAAGRTDDINAVVMAMQKAYSALNFTVQVTNKVIEAYREIMRINV